MEGQALTARAQLAEVRGILLSVRIDAVADQWHLGERAVPALTDQAGRTADSRLLGALEHATKAGELLGAARTALGEASKLVEQIVPWPAVESSDGKAIVA
jgi:hypothetical protein